MSKGFAQLKSNAFTVSAANEVKLFRETLPDPLNIQHHVFGGFAKCLYEMQNFNADSERRFAVILEDDRDVLKWFKPEPNQFHIYYHQNAAYEPDFVVETKNQHFLCEPKRADQLELPEIVVKTIAAVKCRHRAHATAWRKSVELSAHPAPCHHQLSKLQLCGLSE